MDTFNFSQASYYRYFSSPSLTLSRESQKPATDLGTIKTVGVTEIWLPKNYQGLIHTLKISNIELLSNFTWLILTIFQNSIYACFAKLQKEYLFKAHIVQNKKKWKIELLTTLQTAALNSCLRLLNWFIYICKLSRILKANQNAICTNESKNMASCAADLCLPLKISNVY